MANDFNIIINSKIYNQFFGKLPNRSVLMPHMTEEISTANSGIGPQTWLDQYGDYLYRFALARINDQAVAEDLVQETFLAALRGYKNFKGDSAIKTWLSLP